MFHFLGQVWTLILHVTGFDQASFEAIAASPGTWPYVIAIVVAAGISLMLGQGLVLMLNRVRPSQFITSLLTSGIIYLVALIAWGALIALLGGWLFEPAPPLDSTLRLVMLGAAPFIYGLFILIPYLGSALARLLYVWAFLIVLVAVLTVYQAGFWQSLLAVGLSWLAILAAMGIAGRPVVAIHKRLWAATGGVPDFAFDTEQEILEGLATDPEPPDSGAEKSWH